MKYLQFIAILVVIGSLSCYSDWDCDPNLCLYDCCTVRTTGAKDICFTPTDISNYDYKTDCPGRNKDTASCSASDCTSNCCLGAACTDSGLCTAAAGLGLCYCLCICCIALVPILIIILIVTVCMKKDPSHGMPPPQH